MTQTKFPIRPAASLTTALLVRKGFARPAMRSPLRYGPGDDPLAGLRPADDLGWNDLGDDHGPADRDVAPIAPGPAYLPTARPKVVMPQAGIAGSICGARESRRPPGTALVEGRRAAFTLRIDAARHGALRLACSLTSKSAQNLLTEALDRLLQELPEIAGPGAQLPPRHGPARVANGDDEGLCPGRPRI